jgi:hypothetical protein
MKGGRGRDSFEIKDFSGGLVTKSPPKNIETKYSVDCLNVYPEGAILRKRSGITVLNPTAASGAGNGLYNWVRGSATTAQWLVGFWGSSLFKMDVVGGAWDGIWDAILPDAASGTAFSASTMYFANFNGVLIMSTDSQDQIQRMTVSENSFFNIVTGGSGTAPRAKFVFNWKNHAWFVNCLNSEDQVVHSAVNSYNNFTGSTFGSNNLLTENDIGCTGGFILNGRLYVMKAFSIHRFTYTGSPSPLVDIRTIKSTTGTKSPRSVKNVNTPEGEVVLFLGANKKLYLCDGQDTQEISDGIDVTNGVATVYMQNINANALNQCFAVVHFDLNWYELFVCIGTATTPNYSIVYDYRMKSFWPMSNRNFTYGNMSDNGSRSQVVYVQGATNGVAYLTNSSNSDAGSAINSFWTSEKIGIPILLQKMDEVEVETDVVACTPTFSWRADWESAWVDNTMGQNTNSHNWNMARVDNMIQFKIADNSVNPSFKLWTILGSQRAVGGGK